MPEIGLVVDGKAVKQPVDAGQLLQQFPGLRQRSEAFAQLAEREVQAQLALFVSEGECAFVPRGYTRLSVVGSDQATTCHIAAVVEQATGLVGVVHFNSETDAPSHVSRFSSQLFDHWQELRRSKADFQESATKFSLYLIGGFHDDYQLSFRLGHKILKTLEQILPSYNVPVHLEVCLTCSLNDTVASGVHYPRITGLAVDMVDLNVQPAQFVSAGPDRPVRTLQNFFGPRDLRNIFDYRTGVLAIEPFSYTQSNHLLQRFSNAADSEILRHLSTSPNQERADYSEKIRSAFQLGIRTTSRCLFAGLKARRFLLDENGLWKQQLEETS